MSQYATLVDLVNRTDGDEMVQRGLPTLRASYRHAVDTAANLVDSVSDPRTDDVALVEDVAQFHRFDGAAWQAITAPKITSALLDASDMADGHMRRRYSLPLLEAPRSLVVAVCDIARFYLYDDNAPEIVTARYKQALAWLRDVSSGVVELDEAEAEISDDGTNAAHSTGPDRVFSRDSMRDL